MTWTVGRGPRKGVAVTTPPVTPPVTPPPVTNAAQAYPEHVLSVYAMCYDVNRDVLVDMPSQINVIRLAFFFGAGTKIIGHMGLGQAAFSAKLIALRNTGVRVQASIGGQHNSIDWNVSTIVSSMMWFNDNICPLDGIDIDQEAGTLPTSQQLLDVMAALKVQRGPNFHISFVPPGGPPVGIYRPMAVAQKQAGNSVTFGQQTYETFIDGPGLANVVQGCLNAGLALENVEIGYMAPSTDYGPDSNYQTTAQAASLWDYVEGQKGHVRGAYLWEAQRRNEYDARVRPADGFFQWVAAMAGRV